MGWTMNRVAKKTAGFHNLLNYVPERIGEQT